MPDGFTEVPMSSVPCSNPGLAHAEPDRESATVEMMFAGHALATHYIRSGHPCGCAALSETPNSPAHHHEFCPAIRFYKAVDVMQVAARKAVA